VQEHERIGETATDPKWAIAWKPAPAEAVTVVEDVVVSVGRSGVCSRQFQLSVHYFTNNGCVHFGCCGFAEIARHIHCLACTVCGGRSMLSAAMTATRSVIFPPQSCITTVHQFSPRKAHSGIKYIVYLL
jgi:hypothetical protein